MRTFLDSLVREDAFVGLNAEDLGWGSRVFIFDEGLESFVSLNASLLLHFFNELLEVFLSASLSESHGILFHPKLLQMVLDVFNGFLIVSEFLFFVSVVITEVSSVKNVILKWVKVVG